MEKEILQKYFSEIITKVSNGKILAVSEQVKLDSLAKEIGGKIEAKNKKPCYWVCKKNHFHCNPDFPPPNCTCIKICL